jgi:hypothetical protein
MLLEIFRNLKYVTPILLRARDAPEGSSNILAQKKNLL